MRSKVYVTVGGPSVRLCPIDRQQQRHRGSATERPVGRTYRSIAAAGAVLQAQALIGNAGSVMLTADEESVALTCF